MSTIAHSTDAQTPTILQAAIAVYALAIQAKVNGIGR
jgi:hypothetical protein